MKNKRYFTNLPDEKKILFSVLLTRITPLNVVEGLGKVAASMANGGSVDGVTILSNKGWQVTTVNIISKIIIIDIVLIIIVHINNLTYIMLLIIIILSPIGFALESDPRGTRPCRGPAHTFHSG